MRKKRKGLSRAQKYFRVSDETLKYGTLKFFLNSKIFSPLSLF